MVLNLYILSKCCQQARNPCAGHTCGGLISQPCALGCARVAVSGFLSWFQGQFRPCGAYGLARAADASRRAVFWEHACWWLLFDSWEDGTLLPGLAVVRGCMWRTMPLAADCFTTVLHCFAAVLLPACIPTMQCSVCLPSWPGTALSGFDLVQRWDVLLCQAGFMLVLVPLYRQGAGIACHVRSYSNRDSGA